LFILVADNEAELRKWKRVVEGYLADKAAGSLTSPSPAASQVR